MNTHSQHKDILFLVSLSPEIIADLEKKEIDISYYLNKIKSFTNVDYRETISRENLAIANQYKVVIVVGHRKGDSLELSNRSLFPMADIVTSLPSDFSGVIDVAVCNSTVIHDAIKKRCPNALVQTAYEETGADFRLPLYSILLQNLPADINYRDAYLLLLEVMEENQRHTPKQELDNLPTTTKLGEEDADDVVSSILSGVSLMMMGPLCIGAFSPLGIMTRLRYKLLRQKMVSISSPEFVTRGCTFQIQVFLHYDSEKRTVEVIAKWRDHNTKSPLQLKAIKDIHTGDKIEIKLSMMDVAIQPTNLILVCGSEHSFTKSPITINDEYIEEVFYVRVTEDYKYPECWARIEMRKSDASEIIKPFDFKINIADSQYSNVDVGVKEDVPEGQRELKPEEQSAKDSVPKCFRKNSKFVRQQVTAVVCEFYLGSAANLALIEIACFDHGLLLKRNNHTAFIETLVAWGAMTCTDVNKTTNSMAYKMRHVPKSGYQEWSGDDYVNDKNTCKAIGEKMGATIPYTRRKEE